MENAKLVYLTVGYLEEAKSIAKAVIEEKLAACANILPNMISFYYWKEALTEDAEVVVLLKTKESLVESLINRIKELHSYEIPCIVVYHVEGGNPDYLDWVRNSL